MAGMEVFGAEERKEVMDVLETGALFRYGHENIRKGMWKALEFEDEVRKQTGLNMCMLYPADRLP
jgi:8-amino-3,8-dideoxy-alpha-D-manno-octulosonate transaminase